MSNIWLGRRNFSFGFDPFENIAYIVIIWEDFSTDGSIRCIRFSTQDKACAYSGTPQFEVSIWNFVSICNNGLIYWKSKATDETLNGHDFLLSYCPATRCFGRLYLPDFPVGTKSKLVDYDGYVAILSIAHSGNNSKDVTVWLFQNVSDYSSSWTRHSAYFGIPLNVRILGVMQQLLFRVEKDPSVDMDYETTYINSFTLSLFSSDGDISKRELFLPNEQPSSIVVVFNYCGSLIVI